MDTKGKKSAADVLRDARRIVSAKERWTQSANARDADGISVDPLNPRACQWCALGAVIRAEGVLTSHVDEITWSASRDVSDGAWNTEVSLNDATNHATVLRMFDRAIDLAVAEEEACAA